MPKLFAVVTYPEEQDKVAVVPLSWLTEDRPSATGLQRGGVFGSKNWFETGWTQLQPGKSTQFVLRLGACSPRHKEAPQGEGLEQTMPLLIRILRVQLGIRQQQREVLQEVRQLKHEVRLLSVPQHAQPAQPPVDLLRLPAGTIRGVDTAEAAVQSEAVAAALRKNLLQIGGRGLREIGVNAMKAVLAHDVQLLYSLRVRKRKRAFVD
ncbi:uncharacterized protein LOC142776647 [Rhipicephalus microplus]|uniref:uncharacterized protein LOC142776647 n=1 Tax=Rhipicephalus microplus TaxID=6941 RepID=UPI003F6A7D22